MALCHARSGEIVNLEPLGAGLKDARTAALVKNGLFETVRLVVHVGKDIKTHAVDGPVTLHCLEGRVLLGLPGSDLELSAGQWLYLEGGVQHSMRALENASLLMTIMFPPQDARREGPRKPAAATDRRTDSLLDQGLVETFPASDAVAVSNPVIGIRTAHGPGTASSRREDS